MHGESAERVTPALLGFAETRGRAMVCRVAPGPLDLIKPLRVLRQRTAPVRVALRRAIGSWHVQRTARLRPEDVVPKRRRRHVLVDLVNHHCPPAGARVAEVGTREGATAAHLLRYCPGIERLYAIDLEPPPQGADCIAGLDRVELVLGDSAACAGRFADASLHLVFIDADHDEAAVRRDLEAWLPKLVPGGILCGHDYGSRHTPGVKAAVDAFFAGHPHRVRRAANKVWWTFR